MPAARDEDWGAIAAQASAGATLEQLSEHWNIPLGTLKDRCASGGWKRAGQIVQSMKGDIQPNPTERENRSITLLPKLGDKSKLVAAKLGHTTLQAIRRKSKGEYGDDKLIALAPTLNTTVNTLAKVHDWGSSSQDNRTLVNINLLNSKLPDA